MASAVTFGYFLLGLGPGLAFFLVFIFPKSFLVLLTFTSAFYWLVVLLLTACIFRGFLPVSQAAGPYAGLLVGAVVLQELGRWLLWLIHSKTSRVLEIQARASGQRFELVDKLYLALGWGWGHGAAHAIFFYLSFLPLTTSDATWYLDTCPRFSIFLAGAMYCLAFGMLLTSLMVIAWEGFHERHRLHVVYVPCMHLGAALLSLLNMRRDGCLVAMPLLLGIGALNMAYAAQLCWRKAVQAAAATAHGSLATDSVTPLVEAEPVMERQLLQQGSSSSVSRRLHATSAIAV